MDIKPTPTANIQAESYESLESGNTEINFNEIDLMPIVKMLYRILIIENNLNLINNESAIVEVCYE